MEDDCGSTSGQGDKKKKRKVESTHQGKPFLKDVVVIPNPSEDSVPTHTARSKLESDGLIYHAVSFGTSWDVLSVKTKIEELFPQIKPYGFHHVKASSGRLVVPTLELGTSVNGAVLRHLAGQGNVYIRSNVKLNPGNNSDHSGNDDCLKQCNAFEAISEDEIEGLPFSIGDPTQFLSNDFDGFDVIPLLEGSDLVQNDLGNDKLMRENQDVIRPDETMNAQEEHQASTSRPLNKRKHDQMEFSLDDSDGFDFNPPLEVSDLVQNDLGNAELMKENQDVIRPDKTMNAQDVHQASTSTQLNKRKHNQIEFMAADLAEIDVDKLLRFDAPIFDQTHSTLVMDGQGHDLGRFLSKVKPDLCCLICFGVLNNPRWCQNNNHQYCLACITLYLKNPATQECPTCRQHLTPETLKNPQKLLFNLLSELIISCDYYDRGCPAYVKLGSLQLHLDHCRFGLVTSSVQPQDYENGKLLLKKMNELDGKVDAIGEMLNQFLQGSNVSNKGSQA